ncbi:MAG: hypothetical protein R3C08_13585 [Hyphomonas sp.]
MIIPEYKNPVPEIIQRGVTLFTVHVRRTGPAEQDQKLSSHSKLNCILACIQADKAGADEALMLDPLGFVATCNSTHFFMRDEKCGPARRNIALVASRAAISSRSAAKPASRCSKRFSLFDVYSADEAFITGTFAGEHPCARWTDEASSTLTARSRRRSATLTRPSGPQPDTDCLRRLI